MRTFLLAIVVLLAACGGASLEHHSDSTPVDSIAKMRDTALPHPRSTVLDSVKSDQSATLVREDSVKIATAMSQNTPQGWSIMDTLSGDLNRDKYTDFLIVLQHDEDSLATDEPRPLLILIGNDKGELVLTRRNDNVVLCRECGGVFGDPYDGLAIKNGYFSVQHYGGSAWRWTRIITFRYHEKEKDWFLHKDGGVSYYLYDIDGDSTLTESFENQDKYGKQKFEDYNGDQ